MKSKKEGKDQEAIQSSTTPDPGYQWESYNVTISNTFVQHQTVTKPPAKFQKSGWVYHVHIHVYTLIVERFAKIFKDDTEAIACAVLDCNKISTHKTIGINSYMKVSIFYIHVYIYTLIGFLPKTCLSYQREKLTKYLRVNIKTHAQL